MCYTYSDLRFDRKGRGWFIAAFGNPEMTTFAQFCFTYLKTKVKLAIVRLWEEFTCDLIIRINGGEVTAASVAHRTVHAYDFG